MKKGSQARKCKSCKRIVFWTIPTESILGIQLATTKTVLDFRYRREKGAEYGYYYCMDCLKQKYPGEY